VHARPSYVSIRPHFSSKHPLAEQRFETDGLDLFINKFEREIMRFSAVVVTLNNLLATNQPDVFNSSWVRKHAPNCYRLIQRKLRREFGGIDWDRLTYALDRKFQRRWFPGRTRRKFTEYEDVYELDAIMKKYRDKMYVFVAPLDEQDRQIRDVIGISFVRLAQKGNLLARRKLMDLVHYTIDDWLERYDFLSRWRGYEEDMQKQVVGCIRRYRYTGSFLNYLFRTLECAGRGIPSRLL
jgi:hypothetical protein